MTYENAWYSIAGTSAQIVATLSGIFFAIGCLRVQQLESDLRDKFTDLSVFFARIGLYGKFQQDAWIAGMRRDWEHFFTAISKLHKHAAAEDKFGNHEDWERSPYFVDRVISDIEGLSKLICHLRKFMWIHFALSMSVAAGLIGTIPLAVTQADTRIGLLLAASLGSILISTAMMRPILTSTFDHRSTP